MVGLVAFCFLFVRCVIVVRRSVCGERLELLLCAVVSRVLGCSSEVFGGLLFAVVLRLCVYWWLLAAL